MLLKTRTLHFFDIMRRQQEECFFLPLPYYKSFGKASGMVCYSWHNIPPQVKDKRRGDEMAEYLKNILRFRLRMRASAYVSVSVSV